MVWTVSLLGFEVFLSGFCLFGPQITKDDSLSDVLAGVRL